MVIKDKGKTFQSPTSSGTIGKVWQRELDFLESTFSDSTQHMKSNSMCYSFDQLSVRVHLSSRF